MNKEEKEEIKKQFDRDILPRILTRYGYKDHEEVDKQWFIYISNLQKDGKLSMEELNQIGSYFGYETDWTNVDLNRESDKCILESITFDDLLLIINSNCSEINRATVKKEFEERLKFKVAEAKFVFNSNLLNIINKAVKERKEQGGE